MKKISLFYISDSDKKIYDDISKKRSNRIFSLSSTGKPVFCNNFQKWERYDLKLFKLEINQESFESISKLVFEIVKLSHDQIAQYGKKLRPKENFDFVPEYSNNGKLDPEEVLLKDIQSWLNSLDLNKSLDIFNICCWIPFKLLTNRHIWNNGNKRTALATCINLLRYFKLYLSYSDNHGISDDGKDRWYNLFTKYVRDDKHPERCVELNKKAYYDIYKRFFNDIIIAIYFDVYSIKED